MACTNVFDAFKVPSEDLNESVYNLAHPQSIWLNFIPRSTYRTNRGITHSVFSIGNQEPATDEETWAAITLNDNQGADACDNSFTDVEAGYDEITYSPEQFQLRGPLVCRKELTYSWNIETFLNEYIVRLARRAQRTWENRYETLHIRNSLKVVATPALDTYEQAGYTGMAESECELTQDMLDQIAMMLVNNGVTNPNSNGFITWGQAGPTFTLYIGPDISIRLFKTNSELREDVRQAYQGTQEMSPLLARLYSSRNLGNFKHVVRQFPPRYTFNAGTYTRVNTWEQVAGTKGTKASITAAYRAATHEAALVLAEPLYTSEIVPPMNSAAGLSWTPQNYMGDWRWVTGAYKFDTDCVDPLEDKGRHFAELAHAPKVNPLARYKWGAWIVYKRCLPLDFACTTCSS